ncbi:hypothetical protein [Alkalithermobacter paradoxus]|uniref:Uncharacterized protein n=1 Tax=Alkalithermobacter paradoxus TaxID=29349 RepID=A0A1V4I5Z6_9FIRM|nr:hypothetical protein CLOTH_14560 [[Clostridium] thermoalcaliphilum]
MLYYCMDCKRVFNNSSECTYCSCNNVKKLNQNAPVNVIGSKIKGRILKAKSDNVRLIYVDSHKNTIIKDFDVDKIRKIL